MQLTKRRIVGSLAAWGCLAACAQAAIVTVPAGLNPGDPYRLVFVTNGHMAALSSDIADYNSFVTSQAEAVPALAALGVTWTAIGSTDSIDAIDNIGTPAGGVYNLAGAEVAGSTAQMFSLTLLAPIDIDQFGGTPGVPIVFTGTSPSGQGSTSDPSNDTKLGGSVLAEFGLDTLVTSQWVDFGETGSSSAWGIYGISSVLIAPPLTGTPEPGGLGLAALGILSAWVVGSRTGRLRHSSRR